MSIEVVEWIMGCIESTSFVVLINGAPSSFFRPTRGIRQGFPLSPFLFLLVAEALSRLIHQYKEVKKIEGVKVSSTKEITHTLFVDDGLLLGKGTVENFRAFP